MAALNSLSLIVTWIMMAITVAQSDAQYLDESSYPLIRYPPATVYAPQLLEPYRVSI